MKKIKVLRIVTRLNIGGPAVHAILLTEGLNKNSFETLLVSGDLMKDEGGILYYAEKKKVKPIFISDLKRNINLYNDIKAFIRIYKIILKVKPDIMHTHTAKAGALGRSAALLFNLLHQNKRIQIIHTFHGHIFAGYFNKALTTFFIAIEKFFAFFSHKIITVSESLKEELIHLGICNINKIEVIPLGIELSEFMGIGPRDNGVVSIGIIARLTAIKNHNLFLEVAAMTINKNPGRELRFKVIGDGQLLEKLKQYANFLNINQYVEFLGWQKDLVNVYRNLDIVALTSLNEGTPVALIEGMASGRPVVATDVGGVSDLIGQEKEVKEKPSGNFKISERGLLVTSKDVQGFADALSYLIENKELRYQMGASGRAFVKNRFEKNRLTSDIENLYLGIINQC